MSFKVVIPARYASTRLPGKALLTIKDKPIVQYVYENACDSGADQVIIATDDQRIVAAAEKFNADVCLTSDQHTSGTDRIAEVVKKYNWSDDIAIVNVQGDEPQMPAENNTNGRAGKTPGHSPYAVWRRRPGHALGS